MADFSSTKKDATFNEWYEQLLDYADLRGESADDEDAWWDDYEAGKAVADAWHDKWGDD